MSTSDEDLVNGFTRTWALGLSENTRARMAYDLHAILAAARASTMAVLATRDLDKETRGHVEARARALLAKLAPPGTTITPQLIADVKQQIVTLVHEELVASGLSTLHATALATVIATAIKITEK